jgi:CubicO group peptidase (beta-lactamase class C family)
MEDMKVTATGYDFRPAHAAMQRYVDGNLLSGFSSAVLVGRELVDVKFIGWADKVAQIPLGVDHIFRVFSNTKLITSDRFLKSVRRFRQASRDSSAKY